MRHGLRKQGLGDLHDYLDVHRRLPLIVGRLHNEVVAGSYRPREPEFISMEKKLGITRRVVIPSAEDAIVLQALVDAVEIPLLRSQPTKNAYYSRSHAPPSVYDIDHSVPDPWWELWPEFQARIWSFARDNPFVAVTDIANYFDSIPLQTLRNRLVSIARLKEELVDFLFFLLEHMQWRPDYVPSSGVGLPQIQFDAPRLLAHTYLFEVDHFLERSSQASVVRWMDDINIGVKSEAEGKQVLRDLDEMLAAMGLRLNTGKSQILSGEEVLRELWVAENRRLNAIDNIITQGNRSGRAGPYAERRFRTVWEADRTGAWGKIVRRFFSVFTRLGSPFLERYVPEVLQNLPGVRDKVFKYYMVLGYSPRRFRQIAAFLRSGHCTDNTALDACLQLLVGWAIPKRSPYRGRALRLVLEVLRTRSDSHVSVAGAIAVFAKYSSPAALRRFATSSQRTWRRSEWAARQVAAVTPVLGAEARPVRSLILGYGLRDATEVLLSLQQIRLMTHLDGQMRSYLLQPAGRYPYPFSKVLVALTLFSGRLDPSDRATVRDHIVRESRDPRYSELLAAAV